MDSPLTISSIVEDVSADRMMKKEEDTTTTTTMSICLEGNSPNNSNHNAVTKSLDVGGETTPCVDMNTNNIGIYDEMLQNDDDDIITGLSFVSAGDLYDDAVMGLLDDDFSQKTKGSDDDVFEREDDTTRRGAPIQSSIRGRGAQSSSQENNNDNTVKNDSHEHDLSPQNKDVVGCIGSRKHNSIAGRFAFYIGNLTWWTSIEDIKTCLKLVGVMDVLEIKIFECRANGQSKGYALVTFGSEGSMKLAGEQLDKTKIHNRIPTVKPDCKASSLYFESLTKTRPPPTLSTSSSNGEQTEGGSLAHRGSKADAGLGTSGTSIQLNGGMRYGGGTRSQLSQQQFHPRNFGPRLPPPPPTTWSHLGNPGGNRYPPPLPRGVNSMYYGPPRGPPPPMLMPGYGPPPPPPHQHTNYVDEWRGSPSGYNTSRHPRVHVNPAFLNRLPLENYTMTDEGVIFHPLPPEQSGLTSYNMNSEYEVIDSPERLIMSSRPGALTNSPHLEPSQATEAISCRGSYIISSTPIEEKHSNCDGLSDIELDVILDGNDKISSMAIQRAVEDASNGEYASAIETLVTAISIIRGSKVSKEKRTEVLVSSLQESLEGIEHQSYGRQNGDRPSHRDKKSDLARQSPPLGHFRSSRPRDYYSSSRRDYHHNYHDGRGNNSSNYYTERPSRRRSWDGRDRDFDFIPRSNKVARVDDGREQPWCRR